MAEDPQDPQEPSTRRKALGLLAGAAVAAAGVAITLVGGLLGSRRQQRQGR